MELSLKKKTDRRTLYTKNMIKETLLKLMHKKPFHKITVKELCEKAEINRGTFYLHYNDIFAVLDELEDDALGADCGSENTCCHLSADTYECPYGICDKIHTNPKYGVIFFDDSLTNHIVEKIAAKVKDKYIRELLEQCDLTYQQAETLFYFQLNGCLAINKNIYRNGIENWQETRDLVGGFIQSGYLRYLKK